ncbi:ribonuclease N [Gordonia alkaliphila]|uniref:Uncharacterized protein n=1 Tax=Gordonia alkaliphila TaxID=1053547 RepID=A0ABP8ZGM8_9ACTN|nr:ribonuclease domain-containing protein [Gordonia alkaliphila]MCK0438760.1 ribonuclease N [Gordonia alkaliphila]
MSRTPASGSRRRTLLSATGALIVLVLAIVWWAVVEPPADETPAASTSVVATPTWSVTADAPATTASPGTPSTSTPQRTTPATKTTAQAPARVLRTLALIDAGDWPDAANAPGTQGGRTFRNNERRLPATGADGRRLTFQEWDVNPKERGRGRDAERIITANDGSAWYTLDHYRTFVLIRGPAR